MNPYSQEERQSRLYIIYIKVGNFCSRSYLFLPTCTALSLATHETMLYSSSYFPKARLLPPSSGTMCCCHNTGSVCRWTGAVVRGLLLVFPQSPSPWPYVPSSASAPRSVGVWMALTVAIFLSETFAASVSGRRPYY